VFWYPIYPHYRLVYTQEGDEIGIKPTALVHTVLTATDNISVWETKSTDHGAFFLRWVIYARDILLKLINAMSERMNVVYTLKQEVLMQWQQKQQELSCCWDGCAMWHKSNNVKVGVGQYSGKIKRKRASAVINHTMSKLWSFDYIFVANTRPFRSSYSQFNTVGYES